MERGVWKGKRTGGRGGQVTGSERQMWREVVWMSLLLCCSTQLSGNESAPIQLAKSRLPGLAISNAKILIYFSNQNRLKQFCQTALGNCYGLKLPKCWLQLRKKFYCVIYYNFRPTIVPHICLCHSCGWTTRAEYSSEVISCVLTYYKCITLVVYYIITFISWWFWMHTCSAFCM